MPVSEKYSFVYIHNPKTAGERIALDGNIFDRVAGGHHKAVTIRKNLGTETYERFFSAAFVRNPYDRVVSAYHYLRDMQPDHRWWSFDLNRAKYIKQFDDFEDFCLRFFRFPVAHRQVGHQLHFMPQNAFLCDWRKRVIVDYVGRFEKLQESWDFICEQTGMARFDFSPESKTNTSDRGHYLDYYSARTFRRINRFYQADFRLFGYRQLS